MIKIIHQNINFVISDAKMKLLILLCAIVLARVTSVPENCNRIKVGNSPVLHKREFLKCGLSSPRWLAVDHSTNILYFGYYTDEYKHSSTLAKINLNNKKV